MHKLSIIIPVYNEKNTVEEIIRRIKAVNFGGVENEIIAVDDGSKDGTREILKNIPGIRYIFHEKNLGKGGAVRTGFKNATGDFLVIQDADLEYDPNEYKLLLDPLMAGKADVVYGSRFIGDRPHRVHLFWHYVGNRVLTAISNAFTNLNLTDMETCYKAFNKKAFLAIRDELKSNRFGIEPEITARIAKHKLRVYEVGISYYGRNYLEGKKINWKDGVAALWHIFYFNFFD